MIHLQYSHFKGKIKYTVFERMKELAGGMIAVRQLKVRLFFYVYFCVTKLNFVLHT